MGMAVAGVQGAEKQFGVRHFAQGHFDTQTRGIKPVTWATAAGVEPGARKCLTFVLEKWLTRLIDHQNSLQLVSFWLTNWSTDWLTCCCNAAVNAELRTKKRDNKAETMKTRRQGNILFNVNLSSYWDISVWTDACEKGWRCLKLSQLH